MSCYFVTRAKQAEEARKSFKSRQNFGKKANRHSGAHDKAIMGNASREVAKKASGYKHSWKK